MNTREAWFAEAGSIVAVPIASALRAAGLERAVESSPSRVALAGEVHAGSMVVAVRWAGTDGAVFSSESSAAVAQIGRAHV